MAELQTEKPVPKRGMFLLSQGYYVAFYLILQVHLCPLVLCHPQNTLNSPSGACPGISQSWELCLFLAC